MNKETLRMQMLAGVITEGQYKAKLEEVDSMGKIGNSYPAPGNTKVTLTSERRKDFEDAIFKRFKELKNEDGPEGAVYDIPYATRDILANILIGRNPNEYWDGEDEWEEALTDKGIDLDEFENYASALETEISRGNTNNPKIQKIQSWVKVSFDESMIGGIVGIGAINQIPATPKTDYEMAFEHFLGERYQIKPNRERDDIEDINEEMGENIADFLNQNMDEVKEKLGDVFSEFAIIGDPKVATAGNGEDGIDVSFDKEHMLELFPEEDPYNDVESIDIAGKTVYYNDYR